MALITIAKNKKAALAKFESLFGMYTAFAIAQEGIVREEPVDTLFSDNTYEFIRRNSNNPKLNVFGSLHFNPI